MSIYPIMSDNSILPPEFGYIPITATAEERSAIYPQLPTYDTSRSRDTSSTDSTSSDTSTDSELSSWIADRKKLDSDLRTRLGMQAVGDFGKNIVAADQAGGGVGLGTALGSGMSGAGAGAGIAALLGSSVATGGLAGGAVGIGAGLLSWYQAEKAKRDLARARKKEELRLIRNQQEYLAKNKDKIALQNKVDMLTLQQQFDQLQRDEKKRRSTAVHDRMSSFTKAINEYRQPTVQAVSEVI